MKLDILAFSLACALFRGLGLCVITWWIIALDGANDMLYCNQRGHATSIWRGYLVNPMSALHIHIFASSAPPAQFPLSSAVIGKFYH